MIVDCPPSLGQLTRSALAAAHRAVLVTDPTMFAVSGVQRAFDAVQTERQRGNPDLQPLGVLINRVRPRNTEHEFRIAELRELFGPLVLSGVLPDRSAIQQAQGACLPIQRWDTPGAREVSAVFTHAARPRAAGRPAPPAGGRPARGHLTPRAASRRSRRVARHAGGDRREVPVAAITTGARRSAALDELGDQLEELLGLAQQVVGVARADQPLDARLGRGPGVGAGSEVGGPLGELGRDVAEQRPDAAARAARGAGRARRASTAAPARSAAR